MKPLAIDLFCGLGGWSDGLIAEGFRCIGYDIEAHEYGDMRYPGELVIADVCTLRGAEFKDATLIVASPPCQAYSWMAMPWSKAKAKAAAIRADETGVLLAELNHLWDQCWRIQREASFAAGRHIPMVVENVRGAQPWVGRARWNFGSFYLYGDVPALMPMAMRAHKVPGFRFDGSGRSFQTASVAETGVKKPGLDWSRHADPDYRTSGKGACFRDSGRKGGGDWFGSGEDCSIQRRAGSATSARKRASAMIAKIPEPLARHIARTFR